jgi:hypothetical protein
MIARIFFQESGGRGIPGGVFMASFPENV